MRDVPIFPKLMDALLREKKESGWVFTNANGGRHTEQSLRRAIQGFLSSMERILNGFDNIENPSGFRTDIHKRKFAEQKREWEIFLFTAHDLRATFATMCYDAGVDMHTLKKMDGACQY